MSNNKFLKQVTVTGADDSVNYYDLFSISKSYPFVEWGILLSKNSEGYPRFPTWKWIEGLVHEKPSGVLLSGHLCGSWVRDIVAGGNAFLSDKRKITYGFGRFQLNFHGQQHGTLLNVERFIDSLRFLTGVNKQQAIFQMDGVNELLYRRAHSLFGRQNGIDAAALYDLSGGCGIVPKEWPEPMGNYCGYAGGLSHENLTEQLEKIEKRITNKDGSLYPIWIDAETHLRSNNDQQFDLDKVTRFLEIAKPHVIGQ